MAGEPVAEILALDVFLHDVVQTVHCPTSWICTILAWTSEAAAWASRSNRFR